MKIFYDNEIDNTTITPSSENSNFPFTALLDNRLSRFGRFTGKDSEYLIFNNTTGIPFTEILIADNNFTENAVVKFQAHIENVWTDPYIDVTLTRLENGYYYYNFTPAPEPATSNFYIDETADTYADESGNNYSDYDKAYYIYCRLIITDTTNTTPLKISKVFIGNGLTMPGIDPSCDLSTKSNSVIQRNLTGQIFTDKRIQLKSGKFKFPLISETQKNELKTLFTTVDITDPFFLLIWENELDKEPPFYAVLSDNLNLKKIDSNYYSTSFEFEEVK
jgi:hypothetical protein